MCTCAWPWKPPSAGPRKCTGTPRAAAAASATATSAPTEVRRWFAQLPTFNGTMERSGQCASGALPRNTPRKRFGVGFGNSTGLASPMSLQFELLSWGMPCNRHLPDKTMALTAAVTDPSTITTSGCNEVSAPSTSAPEAPSGSRGTVPISSTSWPSGPRRRDKFGWETRGANKAGLETGRWLRRLAATATALTTTTTEANTATASGFRARCIAGWGGTTAAMVQGRADACWSPNGG
mmetsp:Transcript_106864/g.300449  ORF Transcript_106864/g.300449 Transcript_106864/m.300449 type:complete len:237 (-) Transcript_106864:15-725(-)